MSRRRFSSRSSARGSSTHASTTSASGRSRAFSPSHRLERAVAPARLRSARAMPMSAFVFDAYGTLFDVHAAIARHRDEVGPDADRLSELWRGKQLEYTWTLTLAGHYADFWSLTQQALDHA